MFHLGYVNCFGLFFHYLCCNLTYSVFYYICYGLFLGTFHAPFENLVVCIDDATCLKLL